MKKFLFVAACMIQISCLAVIRPILDAGQWDYTLEANQNSAAVTDVFTLSVPDGYLAEVTVKGRYSQKNAESWLADLRVGDAVRGDFDGREKTFFMTFSGGGGSFNLNVTVSPEYYFTGGGYKPYKTYYCRLYYTVIVAFKSLAPDLSVTTLSTTPLTDAIIDESKELNFTVKNIGNVTAAATTAKIYDGPVKLGEIDIPSLSASSSVSKFYDITLLAAGAHTLKVEIGAVPKESSTVDNSRTTTLMVHQRTPYEVRFDANGGSGTMPNQKFIFGTAQNLSPNTYTHGDAIFRGWSRVPKGNAVFMDKDLVNNLDLDGDGIETLYAVWLTPNVEDVLYTVENGEVTITGVRSDFSGDLLIPSFLEGFPVTSIGGKAFSGNKNLTSVITPATVTEIGECAFLDCVNLKTIILPENLKAIRDGVLCGCVRLSSIEIPEGVTEIERSAMSRCNSLKTLTIPSSVRNIGACAFSSNPYDNAALSEVTILPGVTNIGGQVFGYCTNLRTIVIPEGVISMSDDAFMGCESLVSVALPSTLKELTSGSFRGAFISCISLKTLIFNGDAPSIEKDFDSDCSDCTAYVKTGSAGWGVTIPGKWHGINIEYQPDKYTVAYALRGGVHGADHPTDVDCGGEFLVSAPKRAGRSFVGWTVTGGLDASVAKWGASSNAWMPIKNSETVCANGATGSVWFKNLTAVVDGHVTLTANWTSATEYDILLLPGNGKGNEQVIGVAKGCVGKLPANTFTPPDGKLFAGWACSNGRRYDDGVLVFNLAEPGETVTMTAIWE